MKAPQQTAELAKRYSADKRTIRRWRAAGAPLDDPPAMAAWLASRRQIPPRTTEGGRADKSPPVSAPSEPPTRGAPAALKRLEAAEASAFTALEAAISGGDLLAIRSARKAWLEIALALARFDRQVELFRRDAGAVVERADVERSLEMLGRFWRIAVMEAANNLSTNINRIEPQHARRSAIIEAMDTGFQRSLAGLQSRIDAPDWLLTALKAHQDSLYRHSTAAIDACAEDFKAWVDSGRASEVADVAALGAEIIRQSEIIQRERKAAADAKVWRSEELVRAEQWFLDRVKLGLCTQEQYEAWKKACPQ